MRKILYLLGQFSEQDVDWLIAAGQRERWAQGQTLIQQGTFAPALYIVLDGGLNVYAGMDQHSTLLATMLAGDLIGEMSFVDASPASATVIAVEDTLLFAIPKDVLTDKLEGDAIFARNFYRALSIFLSDRVRAVSRRAGEKAESDAVLDEDELDPNVLDQIYLAGTRFDDLIQRLMAVE